MKKPNPGLSRAQIKMLERLADGDQIHCAALDSVTWRDWKRPGSYRVDRRTFGALLRNNFVKLVWYQIDEQRYSISDKGRAALASALQQKEAEDG